MKKKMIIIISLLLIGMAAFSTLTVRSVEKRNKEIDLIIPCIEKGEDCIYTDEDIEKAVETIKESFKKKDWKVRLVSVSYDDKDNAWFWDTGYHLKDDYGEKDRIYLQCDYFVLEDFAAYSKGYYRDFGQIIVRDNENSPWKIVDGGYA